MQIQAQMDSLYVGSMELNERMNSMVSEFERENNERFAAGYRTFVLERNNSYYVIAGLALFCLFTGNCIVYPHPPGFEPPSPVREGT